MGSLQFVQCQEPVAAGPRQGLVAGLLGNFGLGELQTIDLAADCCPVSDVQGKQPASLDIVTRLEVRLGKGRRQVSSSVKREIHCQKCHVGNRVGIAKTLVELDAIDDDEVTRRGTIGKEIDVVEVQIAVRVARDATFMARAQSLREIRVQRLVRSASSSLFTDRRTQGYADRRVPRP